MLITFYLLLIGLVGCLLLAFISLISGWLTRSGALLLVLLGTAVFTLSPVMAGYLALFFAMSYLLHGAKKAFHLGKSTSTPATAPNATAVIGDDDVLFTIAEGTAPKRPEDCLFAKNSADRIAKSGPRDGWQVAANCGPLLLALLWQQLAGGDPRLSLCQIAVIAGAAADTWSSEIGVLSHQVPHSLVTGRPLAAGLSGGITLLGTAAGATAAGLLAAAWWLPNYLFFPQNTTAITFWLPALCGFAATWIDSLLGAVLQQKYRCPVCGEITENPQHHGVAAVKISGVTGFNNDTVNFFSGLLTLGLAYLWLTLF